jgi:hypothetical protein
MRAEQLSWTRLGPKRPARHDQAMTMPATALAEAAA